MQNLTTNSPILSAVADSSSPLAVVAHDAGAGNLIIGWLKDLPELKIKICVDGPAIKLFSSAFPDLKNCSLTNVFDGVSALLSGTGGGSPLEHNARCLAREQKIPSIGVIDHWVNYRLRFNRDNVQMLPDEIWVSDKYAFDKASQCFSGHMICQMPNSYLLQLTQEIKTSSNIEKTSEKTCILYVLEPMHEAWGDCVDLGEFQALDYFMDKLDLIGLKNKDVEIRLRPHPSDHPNKYHEWCEAHKNLNISIDSENKLSDLIAWADWVVGCETFAMVIALHAKRRTLSTLPPWAPQCRLPQKEIIKLRDS